MDSKELFESFEGRMTNGELTKKESGGFQILTYQNRSEGIFNGKCKRTFHTYYKNDKVVGEIDVTIGIVPKFKSWTSTKIHNQIHPSEVYEWDNEKSSE